MLESQEWSGLTEGVLEEAADVRGVWGMAGCSAWATGSGEEGLSRAIGPIWGYTKTKTESVCRQGKAIVLKI